MIRRQGGMRWFPAPVNRSDVMIDPSPASEMARQIVAIADIPLSWRDSLWNWGNPPMKKLGLLVHWHRYAMQAENKGATERADFYWREILNWMERWGGQTKFWSAIVLALGDKGDIQGEMLRGRLVDELLIDSLCACANGSFQTDGEENKNNRAFIHFGYIQSLLPWSTMLDSQKQDFSYQLTMMEIRILAKMKQWDKMKSRCKVHLKQYPNDKEGWFHLALIYHEEALALLKNDATEAESRSEAVSLRTTILSIEEIRDKHPKILRLYPMLGMLCRLRAIKQANGSDLAEALTTARKAIAYYPHEADAKKILSKLREMMITLQQQVQRLQEELRSHPNATLNPDGLRMVEVANKGFQSMRNFENTSECRQLENGFHWAFLVDVWVSEGLPEPPDDWKERAKVIMGALQEVIAMNPTTANRLESKWNELRADQSVLQSINSSLVLAFLKRRILGETAEIEASQETSKLQSAVQTEGTAFDIHPLSKNSWRAMIPFFPWLFGGQDRLLKGLSAVAFAALLITGKTVFDEINNRELRDQAYLSLQSAVSQNDHESVMQQGIKFLSVKLKGAPDPREEQVRQLFERALVLWFVAADPKKDKSTSPYLAFYRQWPVSGEEIK